MWDVMMYYAGVNSPRDSQREETAVFKSDQSYYKLTVQENQVWQILAFPELSQ
jgi:hypothetical protein